MDGPEEGEDGPCGADLGDGPQARARNGAGCDHSQRDTDEQGDRQPGDGIDQRLPRGSCGFPEEFGREVGPEERTERLSDRAQATRFENALAPVDAQQARRERTEKDEGDGPPALDRARTSR